MLSLSDATDVVKAHFPKAQIRAGVPYRNDYVFVVYPSNTRESFFDPYYAVDKNTGEFRDFSIFTDADPEELTNLLTATLKDDHG